MLPLPTPPNPGVPPLTTSHLKILIVAEMSSHGHDCSLNHIDVSNITDFRNLFEGTEFNGDVSRWNVSRGSAFTRMFAQSAFNGDLSNWDTSNAESMAKMFYNCVFNGDVSRWDVSKVQSAACMFLGTPFDGDLSQWKFASGIEPSGLSGLVAHKERDTRKKLKLPLLSVECNELFLRTKPMESWLAAQLVQSGMSRYHWDALLRYPESPWATPEMQTFAQTYLSIAPELPESCVAQSAQIMQMWEAQQYCPEDTLTLPSMESTP